MAYLTSFGLSSKKIGFLLNPNLLDNISYKLLIVIYSSSGPIFTIAYVILGSVNNLSKQKLQSSISEKVLFCSPSP